MTRPRKTGAGLEVSERELPTLPSTKEDLPRLSKVTLTRGISSFSSTLLRSSPDADVPRDYNIREGVILEWQIFDELTPDHGLLTSFEVLFEAGFGPEGSYTDERLTREIRAKSGEKEWGRIEKHLAKLGPEDDPAGHRSVFLTAAWAEYNAKPFEELWLAAMAEHAYFVLENDFAFGYLVAQLVQKRDHEVDALRGKRTLSSARQGGISRSNVLRRQTQAVLEEMRSIIDSGHSISNAADLAHKRGVGTSPGANRRLWSRHAKK